MKYPRTKSRFEKVRTPLENEFFALYGIYPSARNLAEYKAFKRGLRSEAKVFDSVREDARRSRVSAANPLGI